MWQGKAGGHSTDDYGVASLELPCPEPGEHILELVIGPKKGPALHTHLREDELWYVIDGDFRFKAGGVMLQASTGGMAFGPRGTPHGLPEHR